MKLSKTQEFTLRAIKLANDFDGRDAYLETGTHKPFNRHTIRSLERRGLIEVTNIVYTDRSPIYYARLKGDFYLSD